MASFRKALPFVAALVAWAAVGVARAEDPLDGELEIRSAYAVPNHGVIMLSAHVAYPGGSLLSASLKDGVTLSFDLECIVTRHRRFWFDAEAVDVVQHRELTYHVVTDRYLLRNVDAGTQESFPTLEAALASVGAVVEWPIAVDAQLPGEGPWQIALRAGVRRGHMPDALRALMFWSNAWHRTSDWYTWTLVR
ncbi:MAG: DUF4390 domain-containing protein [Gammaproteobacteria bacterium]|nr:DUF4390 domain-containing protein [Gammaproteobacteria bacterium]MDE2250203.1 DUF4390 domain-containing protein [Gammaproteobacteria bacterium]